MAHDSFQEFMRQRRPQVAQAYVSGDAGPLRAISTATDPATFFGPGGGAEQGAAQVLAVNEQRAKAFAPGSETHFEVLHQGSDGNLAYWTGFQYASARMQDHDQPVPMKLRVTELFRR